MNTVCVHFFFFCTIFAFKKVINSWRIIFQFKNPLSFGCASYEYPWKLSSEYILFQTFSFLSLGRHFSYAKSLLLPYFLIFLLSLFFIKWFYLRICHFNNLIHDTKLTFRLFRDNQSHLQTLFSLQNIHIVFHEHNFIHEQVNNSWAFN